MNPSGHWIIPRCVGWHNGFWKPFLLLCLVHARGTFTGSKLPRGPCDCRKGDTWHQTVSLLSKLGSRYVIEPHRIDLRLGICLFVTYKQLVPPCLRRKQMRCTSIWNNTATKGMWSRPTLSLMPVGFVSLHFDRRVWSVMWSKLDVLNRHHLPQHPDHKYPFHPYKSYSAYVWKTCRRLWMVWQSRQSETLLAITRWVHYCHKYCVLNRICCKAAV